jgi:hypothetical protein
VLRRSADLDLKQLGGSDVGSVLHTGREEDFSDWDEEVGTRLLPFFLSILSFLFLCPVRTLWLKESSDMVAVLEEDFSDWDEEVGTLLSPFLLYVLSFLFWCPVRTIWL